MQHVALTTYGKNICKEGLQPLGGARGEVQLCGVPQEVDRAMVEGVPGGVFGGALVVHILHAAVVWLCKALVEGNATLSTYSVEQNTVHKHSSKCNSHDQSPSQAHGKGLLGLRPTWGRGPDLGPNLGPDLAQL